MTRKKTSVGLGKAIVGDRQRQYEERLSRREAFPSMARASESVLEQHSLEELVATVEMRKEAYAADFGEAEVVEDGPELITVGESVEAEQKASQQRDMMSIPRRPVWDEGMTTDDLAAKEAEAFVEWRREIGMFAQENGLHLTPYERNLDFWRQLWRTIERSDLLVMILDARDPDFYHCRDLARYVNEVSSTKRVMLLVNKADFLTKEQRKQWTDYYAANNIDAIFFSALYELSKQAKAVVLPKGASVDDNAVKTPVPGPIDRDVVPETTNDTEDNVPVDATPIAETTADETDELVADTETAAPLGVLSDSDVDVLDCTRLLEEILSRLPGGPPADATATAPMTAPRRGTVGFVGYPNVGKSTVINAIVGAKKVGMSSRPGKTKHIQTLELPEIGITLCDCPGLVFPSVVATRAHLVIRNTVPIDDLVDCWQPIRLMVKKITFDKILSFYKCAQFVQDARDRSGDHKLDDAHAFLAAFAVSRNHFLRVGVPDENWAARKVLRDFVRGDLLHCEPPPLSSVAAGAENNSCPGGGQLPQSISEEASAAVEVQCGGAASVGDEDDFDDINEFLGTNDRNKQQGMTKRKMRYINKAIVKGSQPKLRAQPRSTCLG
eukprot:TRINITY_DN54572_c0_g1_i1.p1 TRINITY_DN54572_c0_g1~~TRINITY_DN54572_c0_g1_i1.p1  ORF type:complete len:611 (+),score=114.90 TRINITY_DN54572_c0_g1_i1:207-2039(+)